MIRLLAHAALLSILSLAACHRQAPDPAIKAAADAPHVPCALAGATAFAADCTIERIATRAGLSLVLHHPDGGFRRLLVTTDGRGVAAADGAAPARVSILDPATIEVAIAGDRYRLPATVKGQSLPAR